MHWHINANFAKVLGINFLYNGTNHFLIWLSECCLNLWCCHCYVFVHHAPGMVGRIHVCLIIIFKTVKFDILNINRLLNCVLHYTSIWLSVSLQRILKFFENLVFEFGFWVYKIWLVRSQRLDIAIGCIDFLIDY